MGDSGKKHNGLGLVVPFLAMLSVVISAGFAGAATDSFRVAAAIFCGLSALYLMVIFATSEIVVAIESLKSSIESAQKDEAGKEKEEKKDE